MSNYNESKIAEEPLLEAYDSLIGREEPTLPGKILKAFAGCLILACFGHSLYAIWADSTGTKDVFRDQSTPFVIVKPIKPGTNDLTGYEGRPFFDPNQASLTPARIMDTY